MAVVLRNRAAVVREEWKRCIHRFCDVWLCATNRSTKTVRAYRTDLKQFVRHRPKSVSPSEIERVIIEGWVAKLQKRPYAAASIRRKLASLRAFYAYLVASKHVLESPMDRIRIRLGTPKRLTRVVPRKDMRALIRTADHCAAPGSCRRLSRRQHFLRRRDALMIRVLSVTGLRVGELVAIRVDGVDDSRRTIVVFGKGNRERLAYVADHRTAMLLGRFIVEHRRLLKCDTLFPNAGGTAMTTENVRHILASLARAAGTSIRITPHMLRHTAATALLENGADLRVVQEFLGHDSIRSTERYTHVAASYLQRVLRRTNPLRRVA